MPNTVLNVKTWIKLGLELMDQVLREPLMHFQIVSSVSICDEVM